MARPTPRGRPDGRSMLQAPVKLDSTSTLTPATRAARRQTWVGAFVLVGVTAAGTALFSLTDVLLRGRQVVLVHVPDAGGIRRGDPVQMRGVSIGRVSAFELGPQGVLVSLDLESEFPIPADSRVDLRSTGLVGGMVANVIPGRSGVVVGRDDTLSGSNARGAIHQIGDLRSAAERILARTQRLLDDEAIEMVHERAERTRRLLADVGPVVDPEGGEIVATTRSLRQSAGTMEAALAGADLMGALRRLDSLLLALEGTIGTRFGRSVTSSKQALGRVERGRGVWGRLIEDERLHDEVSDAVGSVRGTADALADLAAHLRERPERYLRGSVF